MKGVILGIILGIFGLTSLVVYLNKRRIQNAN